MYIVTLFSTLNGTNLELFAASGQPWNNSVPTLILLLSAACSSLAAPVPLGSSRSCHCHSVLEQGAQKKDKTFFPYLKNDLCRGKNPGWFMWFSDRVKKRNLFLVQQLQRPFLRLFHFSNFFADSNKKCRSNQKRFFSYFYTLEIFPEMCDNCAVFTQGSVLLKKCESMQSIFREWRLKCRDSLGNSFCSAQKNIFLISISFDVPARAGDPSRSKQSKSCPKKRSKSLPVHQNGQQQSKKGKAQRKGTELKNFVKSRTNLFNSIRSWETLVICNAYHFLWS